jgi:hypothetical protein
MRHSTDNGILGILLFAARNSGNGLRRLRRRAVFACGAADAVEDQILSFS